MGALSKCAASTATYPFQVVKARLQQVQGQHGSQHVYTGMVDCVSRIAAHEGARGFFKGIFVNLYKVVPASALTITIYEHVRSTLQALQSVQ